MAARLSEFANCFNRWEVGMKYSGIDLHSNNSVVTVTDEEDRVVAEKRLPNDLGQIVGFLSPWRDELVEVVVESTFNWYWLIDGLRGAGFMVYLANTTAIRKYDGLKHSGDEADARYLARLLRLGILPTGTILPPSRPTATGQIPIAAWLPRTASVHAAVSSLEAYATPARVASSRPCTPAHEGRHRTTLNMSGPLRLPPNFPHCNRSRLVAPV
jgi:Transposase